MHWLLERGGPIDRFNQAVLLQVPAALREEHLLAALGAVLDHHDALRLRFAASPSDGLPFEIAPAGRSMLRPACAASMWVIWMTPRCICGLRRSAGCGGQA